eukprot:TRINITY_DN20875_c0_g1_i1.p1 TRINITY_DN20875_c0_g1~~TRINITY_DN20875_c0_g1_i1.p1  ORF type:complete len:479 (-),score=67.28 TRINITY_DN20875_c0_g1_i1:159-1535(-)
MLLRRLRMSFRACCRRCGRCWAACCSERVISPIVVLSLHGLLVTDVLWHRPELWLEVDARSRATRFLVVATVCCYLQTVFADPGWLRPPASPPRRRTEDCGWRLGPAACLVAPLTCLAFLLRSLCWRRRREGYGIVSGSANASGQAVSGGDGAAAAGAVALGTTGASALTGAAQGDLELGPLPDVKTSRSGEAEGIHLRRGSTNCSSTAAGAGADASTVPSATSEADGGGDGGAVGGADGLAGSVSEGLALTAGSPTAAGTSAAAAATARRWCKRCEMYQPLRTKHCHDCGRCVRTHDHHCPWIGTCVGENNRVFFYWYLIFQAAELLVFFLEGLHGITILEPSVLLAMGLLFIAMFLIMVSCLLGFHSFLLLANLTTWEHASWKRITYLKHLRAEDGSPFGLSTIGNASVYCCGPRWCPGPLRELAGLRYDEDDGVAWEPKEQTRPCWLAQCCGEFC